jgi:hypothetical protein
MNPENSEKYVEALDIARANFRDVRKNWDLNKSRKLCKLYMFL